MTFCWGLNPRLSTLCNVRAGAKDVTLEFVPPAPGAVPDEATLADMAEIVRSLKPAEIKTGLG